MEDKFYIFNYGDDYLYINLDNIQAIHLSVGGEGQEGKIDICISGYHYNFFSGKDNKAFVEDACNPLIDAWKQSLNNNNKE